MAVPTRSGAYANRQTGIASTTPVTPAGKPLNPHVQSGPRKRTWRKTDDELEFEALSAALRSHGGNVAKAAASLSIGRARAYRLSSAHPDFSLEAMRGEAQAFLDRAPSYWGAEIAVVRAAASSVGLHGTAGVCNDTLRTRH